MSVYCAREFSAQDLQTIQGLLAQTPALNRTDLSRRLCEQLHWRNPTANSRTELEDMTCRVALLRMQADGLIALPPSRELAPRRRLQPLPTPASDAQPPLLQPVHELGPLALRPIMQRADSHLWNETIAQQRYGYRPLLLVTFVESGRHRGTCYKAANWIHVGQTTGDHRRFGSSAQASACHRRRRSAPTVEVHSR